MRLLHSPAKIRFANRAIGGRKLNAAFIQVDHVLTTNICDSKCVGEIPKHPSLLLVDGQKSLVCCGIPLLPCQSYPLFGDSNLRGRVETEIEATVICLVQKSIDFSGNGFWVSEVIKIQKKRLWS